MTATLASGPGGSAVIASDEGEVILPAPSALHPVPRLPAALRLLHREQLLQLLQHPSDANSHHSTNPRQLLVFGTHSLRTLLLRQVLSDPHHRVWNNKKKNWDEATTFVYPKNLTIVGTKILEVEISARTGETNPFGGTESLINNSNSNNNEDKVDVVTFFVRSSNVRQTQQVARYIHGMTKQTSIHCRIVYLPQATAWIHKVLRNLGLIAKPNVSIHTLQFDVFPLEPDILSLEADDCLWETDVQATPSAFITTAARALLKIQDVTGPIARLQSYGVLGEEVIRKLLDMTLDEYLAAKDQTISEAGAVSSGATGDGGGDVAALIVMDRKVDLVTPMITPLTYEGLLDDVIGIDCGFVHVDVNIINPQDDSEDKNTTQRAPPPPQASDAVVPKDMVALGVNSSDTLYQLVRNQHVEQFGTFLQNQAIALRESHAHFKDTGRKKDLSEIHQFVRQIPIFAQNLRSLTNHIQLAELVKKTSEESSFRERWQTERSILEGESCYELLEDLVASQYPPLRFLRLLCLQSVCAGGIKSSRYDAIRRDVVQTYGYDYLFVLHNLEKIGLLRRREGLWMDTASSFSNLRKSLVLINPEVDTVEPDDVAYVSSGYAPLTVRLVQAAVKGWTSSQRDEIFKEMPGRHVDVVQQNPPEDLTAALKRKSSGKLGGSAIAGGKKPVLMVMYLGGVTYAEIAAMRFLSKRPAFPFHILICTTKIVNGSLFLESLKGP